jgi:hypothetical protein
MPPHLEYNAYPDIGGLYSVLVDGDWNKTVTVSRSGSVRISIAKWTGRDNQKFTVEPRNGHLCFRFIDAETPARGGRHLGYTSNRDITCDAEKPDDWEEISQIRYQRNGSYRIYMRVYEGSTTRDLSIGVNPDSGWTNRLKLIGAADFRFVRYHV